MSSIPGLEYLAKEGWEIVGFDNLSQDEWFVDSEGRIVQWVYPGGSDEKKIIVRKIEKPKTYRAFANKTEAMLSWDAKVRRKADGSGIFRVVAIGETTIGIGFSLFSFQDAFNCYECNDGTPFGVEVAE